MYVVSSKVGAVHKLCGLKGGGGGGGSKIANFIYVVKRQLRGRKGQRYTYRVLQTIQTKLILLCVWAEPAVLGSTKTALKFK